MSEISYVFAFLSAALSLVLLGYAVATYRQTRDRIMGFLVAGFAVFGLKCLVVGYALLTGRIGHEALELLDNVADLLLLSLIVSPILLAKRTP
jgi:hypothetical protein